MKRRDLTRLLGGAAATWPFVAQAQPAMPVVGFLHSGSPEQNVKRLAAFRKGLNTAGFVEGKNVAIEFRWASGQNARLPELAADLIAKRVAVIATLFQHAGGGRGQGGNQHHSDLLPDRRSTDPTGPRRQLESPGWQRHGDRHLECGAGPQAARAVA